MPLLDRLKRLALALLIAVPAAAQNTVDWDEIFDYPSDCASVMVGVGDTLTCSDSPSLALWNGSFVESFDALVTEAAGVITMTLTASAGGDLTMNFSDGQTTYSTPGTIVLTAGTDSVPQSNYVYIPQATKVLTLSTVSWPAATEHIKVGYFLVPTAAYTGSDGVYINQNFNDHSSDDNGQGHLLHMAMRSRRDGAYYFSGIDGNGTTDYVTIDAAATPDTIYIKATAGVVMQMHEHTVSVFDSDPAGLNDDFHVVNDSTGAYTEGHDLANFLLDSTGASMSGNFYNVVLWGVANKSGEYHPFMINLPDCSYKLEDGAEHDTDGCDVYTMPREFDLDSSTGYMIARITLKHSAAGGGTWTHVGTRDLRRGVFGGGSGSAAAGQTDFSDGQFSVFDDSDPTRIVTFEVNGITPATTRVLDIPDGDGYIAILPNPGNADFGAVEVRAETFETDVATGTAPLIVASTTLVTNLNADLLDGNHAAAFARSLTFTYPSALTSTVAGPTYGEDMPLIGDDELDFTVGSVVLVLRVTVTGGTWTIGLYDATDTTVVAEVTGIVATGTEKGTALGTWPDTTTNRIQVFATKTAGIGGITVDAVLLMASE